MPHDFQSQSDFRCKLDWGIHGTKRAASRGDVIVLVDVLSFSTAIAYAVSLGACIHPCDESDEPQNLAAAIDGELAVKRRDVPKYGRYSLSPNTFDNVQSGEKIVLPSLNGGNCCQHASEAPYVFAGALVNASAVAKQVSDLLSEHDHQVTVIACGEREKEPAPGGDLRVAIEDYLGAGAIISSIDATKSPEASVCEAAFNHNADGIPELLWESVSGRELRNHGFGEDVSFASRIDSVSVVPRLITGSFVAS